MDDHLRRMHTRPPEVRAPGVWQAYAAMTGTYPSSGTSEYLWRQLVALVRAVRRDKKEER
jgi:hypothetical protein